MPHKIDAALLKHLAGMHQFFARYGFYPAALSTGLCAGLFVFRVYFSRTWMYYGMPWNLFLAWMPYLCSLSVAYLHHRYPQRWWLLLPPALVGIAFFPNAPYIVTDFVHLDVRPPVPLWYDIGLLASFAWTGIVLGVYALRILQVIFSKGIGQVLSWLFVLLVLGLSGVGIYLGRFLRWNSWDLVLQPQAVLYDIAVRLRHPLGNKETYGVTLLYAAFMFVCYLALTAAPRADVKA